MPDLSKEDLTAVCLAFCMTLADLSFKALLAEERQRSLQEELQAHMISG